MAIGKIEGAAGTSPPPPRRITSSVLCFEAKREADGNPYRWAATSGISSRKPAPRVSSISWIDSSRWVSIIG